MASSARFEFMVQMTCQNCENKVQSALKGVDGVKSVSVDLPNERVVVETTLPSHQIKQLIEETGRRAVLQGTGSTSQKPLGAAVAMMQGQGVQGVSRMVQLDNDTMVIEGTLDGLSPGSHRLCIHELGDISNGCESCGDIFGFESAFQKKPVGDLGTVQVGDDGRASFQMTQSDVKLWEIIGRSMIIHRQLDQKQPVFNRLACGIIARSSGLFENSKRICACDGVTLWDERDKPIAGKARQTPSAPAAQL